MMSCIRLVCVTILLTVVTASEVANLTTEVVNLTSDAANATIVVLEEKPEANDDIDGGKRSYEGYKLFRVTPESEEHLTVLRFIEKSVDSMWTLIPEEFEVERQSHVDMMVNPEQSENLRTFLECSSIPFEVNDLSSNLEHVCTSGL